MSHDSSLWENAIVPVRHFVLDVLGFHGSLSEDQYVATLPMDIDTAEAILHSLGFTRNPLAWLKHHDNLGKSEGSWRKVDGDRQLHVTLQNTDSGIRFYAHWEYNWFTNPIKHLKEVGYDADEGVKRLARLIDAKYEEFLFSEKAKKYIGA